jgi:hypothetical protein
VGDDLTCEIVARALSAGGVGTLRLVRRTGPLSADVVTALGASNPDVVVETRGWPLRQDADQLDRAGRDTGGTGSGGGWLDVLTGATVVVRSGFDDDPMLRATVRLGVPAVVARGRDDSVEVVSFRRHGPCPHAPLNVPEQSGVPPQDGPGAVVAGHVAAAEVLVLLAGAEVGVARARRISIPLHGATAGEPRSTDISWTPECFVCGGSGSEMSFV